MTTEMLPEAPAAPAAPAVPRDWLLTSARVLVTIIMALVCLTGLGLIAGAILLPLFQDSISASILNDTGKPFGTELLIATEAFIGLILAMGVLAFRWLRQLRRIIDSVGLGDAFAPVNAERLAQMGWLTIGIQVLAIPAGGVGVFLTKHFERSHVDIGLSLSGILMALILFILARVFREGTRMREELEGTV